MFVADHSHAIIKNADDVTDCTLKYEDNNIALKGNDVMVFTQDETEDTNPLANLRMGSTFNISLFKNMHM